MRIIGDLSYNNGPIRRFRSRSTGKRYVAAVATNGDVTYAELDQYNNPINAGKWDRDRFNEMFHDLEMESHLILDVHVTRKA